MKKDAHVFSTFNNVGFKIFIEENMEPRRNALKREEARAVYGIDR